MTLKQTIEAYELLDSATVSGEAVAAALRERGLQPEVIPVQGDQGSTDFVSVVVPGTAGKQAGGEAPTLGIIGRLGGIGARPTAIGLVSDADGAITAIACALKLADMARAGDRLSGDVIVATHICPNAPTQPHDPVPFMGSPVDIATMNRYEVHPEMDAILSIDTTRGNWVINRRGFAISPTVKEGYILQVSPDLLRIMSVVTGRPPVVLPITTQDITPYGNGIPHLNSIMQPATATDAPVVGVALTAEIPVPGCATGASQIADIEMAARFCVEVAKAFGRDECAFYDAEVFERLVALYGSMKRLQTMGGEA
ncbi:MAG TPA: DUF1177 domain-containing protein [Caldilineae bacterium]|nr:DUF1177 domain-containing protein [Caldilineae bacterium]